MLLRLCWFTLENNLVVLMICSIIQFAVSIIELYLWSEKPYWSLLHLENWKFTFTFHCNKTVYAISFILLKATEVGYMVLSFRVLPYDWWVIVIWQMGTARSFRTGSFWWTRYKSNGLLFPVIWSHGLFFVLVCMYWWLLNGVFNVGHSCFYWGEERERRGIFWLGLRG